MVHLQNVDTMTKEELKQAREHLGMTQKELAEALEMQTNSIWRMEAGMQTIRKTTELSVKYLFLAMSKTPRRKNRNGNQKNGRGNMGS